MRIFLQKAHFNPLVVKQGCVWSVTKSNLAELVANAPVELPSLYTQEVVPRMNDATFSGDGPGSIYVVPCHHTDGDSSPLALPDGFWYLGEQ